MMRIRIVSVGKTSDVATATMQLEFEKRLSRWVEVEWRLVPHSKSPDTEGEMIGKHIRQSDFVVLLDERGEQNSVEVMTEYLETWLINSRQLVFVVGGAYGVSHDITRRANFVWSFSQLVFPHQIMRVLLVEQLYRMFSLRSGGKYHHK